MGARLPPGAGFLRPRAPGQARDVRRNAPAGREFAEKGAHLVARSGPGML